MRTPPLRARRSCSPWATPPERLAERLGITRDLAMVKQGVMAASLPPRAAGRQAAQEVRRGAAKNRGREERQDVHAFLRRRRQGKAARHARGRAEEIQLAARGPPPGFTLSRACSCSPPSAITRWTGSQQGDAAWTEIEREKLVFPIVAMFESANATFAQEVITQLEKPLKDIDPRFLLEKFEGNPLHHLRFRQGRGHVLHARARA